MAIGAKLADTTAQVVYVGGDGAFGYAWSELETVARHQLRGFVTIILNNGVFGYQKDAEDVALGDHTKPLYTSPVDHAAIARACGWKGVRVEAIADIEPAITNALADSTPTLIDVISDPDAYPPLVTFDDKLPDKLA
jgi:acetolactate synthase-1/2/3 large subunit